MSGIRQKNYKTYMNREGSEGRLLRHLVSAGDISMAGVSILLYWPSKEEKYMNGADKNLGTRILTPEAKVRLKDGTWRGLRMCCR